jgi:REP element-mobilizing transposase RayT
MHSRVLLHHPTPTFAPTGSWFFITICSNPRGTDQLCPPERSHALLQSATSYHHWQQWILYQFLLMPDHLHAIVGFPATSNPATTIGNWKRLTARLAGVDWQPNFFDHRIRGGGSLDQKAEYIRQNPVRAGLVNRADQWSHVLDYRIGIVGPGETSQSRGSMRKSIPTTRPPPVSGL